MKKIKKTIFTLNVDNYAPEITKLTYPLIKRYADKIDADFYIIKERKFPKFPPVYEKMQIYELGQKMENDWNIYIDSDALVHPDMFDVTEFISKDTICHNGADMANNRWRYGDYFRRDGRHIGSANWFTIASDWCIDLWHPLDIPYEEALENIFPIQNELNTVITREHLIDDYMLSRNIARFGLKFKTVTKIMEETKDTGNYLWHQYAMSRDEKVKDLTRVLANWCVSDYKAPNIPGDVSLSEMIWLYLTAQRMDSIVVVGPSKGKSAHALTSGCPGKVRLEKNVEAAAQFKDKSIDMVFIEGAQIETSVKNDIEAWYPKCKKIVCGGNYDSANVKLGIVESGYSHRLEVGNIWSIDKTKPNAGQ